jgi:hypothetical protein
VIQPVQQLHEGAHGGHGVVAGDRVGVAHLETVTRIPRVHPAHPLQGVARAGVGIVEHRRAAAAGPVIYRQQVGAVAGVAVAQRAGDGLLVHVEVLGERGVEELHDGDVQPVEPEDRRVAGVAVVVPGHRRRDDEVALVHGGPLAVDGGVGAAALEHETQGGLRSAA